MTASHSFIFIGNKTLKVFWFGTKKERMVKIKFLHFVSWKTFLLCMNSGSTGSKIYLYALNQKDVGFIRVGDISYIAI